MTHEAGHQIQWRAAVMGIVPRGFRQGVEAKFSTSPTDIANLLSLANVQGVSGDTTPPP